MKANLILHGHIESLSGQYRVGDQKGAKPGKTFWPRAVMIMLTGCDAFAPHHGANKLPLNRRRRYYLELQWSKRQVHDLDDVDTSLRHRSTNRSDS